MSEHVHGVHNRYTKIQNALCFYSLAMNLNLQVKDQTRTTSRRYLCTNLPTSVQNMVLRMAVSVAALHFPSCLGADHITTDGLIAVSAL